MIESSSKSSSDDQTVLIIPVCLPVSKNNTKYGKCYGPKQWYYTNPLGVQGAFGSIWQACCDTKCNFVAKYQKFAKEHGPDVLEYGSEITEELFINEIKVQNALSKFKISVPVLDWWICEEGATFVMPALKQTLLDLLREFKGLEVRLEILGKARALIEKLHIVGYVHRDLHSQNIMVDFDSKTKFETDNIKNELKRFRSIRYRFYLIDFGFAMKLPRGVNEKTFIHINYDYSVLNRSIERESESLPNPETIKQANIILSS